MSTLKTLCKYLSIICFIFYILGVNDHQVSLSVHLLVDIMVANLLIVVLVKANISTRLKWIGSILQVLMLLGHVYLIMVLEWSYGNRLVSAILFIISIVIEFTILRQDEFPYVYSEVGEEAISFEDIRRLKTQIAGKFTAFESMGKVMTPAVIKELFMELPRNSVLRYINKNSLSDTYLENLEQSLEDQHVYIVLSDTGSPASEFIGVFTKRSFNHASISFDRELKTLISYNGGAKVSPPGLNAEMIEHFYRKEDASIRIYSLLVTTEQKEKMIREVIRINEEGSAYNLVGLALKKNYRPNIMFCSQFVYQMLCLVDAQYFVKSPSEVRPTDLIELDYDRKLSFIEQISVNSTNS